MPLRYGKKKRYSKKKRYRRGKRKSKYGKRRKRYGKSKRYLSKYLKGAQKYTTLYRTACRCVSKPAACQYYVLSPDPLGLAWKNSSSNSENRMMGDMTWRGYRDVVEALRGVQRDFLQTNLASTDIYDGTLDSGHPIASQQAPPGGSTLNSGDLLYPGPNASIKGNYPQIDFQQNYIFGKNKYQLFIKSAITGGNVNITLYKCVARYDVPFLSNNAAARPACEYILQKYKEILPNKEPQATTGLTSQSFIDNIFDSLHGLHNYGWALSYRGRASSLTPVLGAQDSLFIDRSTQQEGTTLYDNKLWCSMFKIQKSFSQELLPGQQAMLKMKQKMSKVNHFKQLYSADNMLVNKGQIVYVLKVQGAIGHEPGTDGDTPYIGANRFYGGSSSRPGIGLMAAAVDVMCWKKLCIYASQQKIPRIKNIVSYNDYLDNITSTGTNGAQTDYPINKFIDSAPSDYAATNAAIN